MFAALIAAALLQGTTYHGTGLCQLNNNIPYECVIVYNIEAPNAIIGTSATNGDNAILLGGEIISGRTFRIQAVKLLNNEPRTGSFGQCTLSSVNIQCKIDTGRSVNTFTVTPD